MSQNLRGKDIKISIRSSDGPVTPLSINTGSVNFGLQSEEIQLVGEETQTDGFNGPGAVTIDQNLVGSSVLFDVMDAQRAKNDGDADRISYVIQLEVSVTLPNNGGRVRYGFNDCTLTTEDLALPGTTDRSTWGWAFACPADQITRIA